MFDSMFNDWSSTKSYATRENLEKALVKNGLDKCKPLAVRTPEGRWTALFAKSFLGETYVMTPVWLGFKVLG